MSKNIFNDRNLKSDVIFVTKMKKEEIDIEKYKLNYFNQYKWEYLKQIKYQLYLEKKEIKENCRNVMSAITLIKLS